MARLVRHMHSPLGADWQFAVQIAEHFSCRADSLTTRSLCVRQFGAFWIGNVASILHMEMEPGHGGQTRWLAKRSCVR